MKTMYTIVFIQASIMLYESTALKGVSHLLPPTKELGYKIHNNNSPHKKTDYHREKSGHRRIVGGSLANIKDFPSMACMVRKTANGQDLCGGAVIISGFWALTAAHVVTDCFYENDFKEKKMYVRSNTAKWQEKYTEHLVVKSYVHQKYTPYNYDIALLKVHKKFDKKLEKPIQFVGSSYKYKNGSVATVLGWGWTEANSYEEVDELRRVNVKIVDFTTCKKRYEKISAAVTNHMICAMEHKKDACFLDSGGPLYQNKKLIGLVSFGPPGACGHATLPGVYAKISSFSDWLHSKIRTKKKKAIALKGRNTC